MFAVIYRSRVKPGKEVQYQECWKMAASYFVQERGALGSTLHHSEEGLWIAYSRWPDKATRDASWPDLPEGSPVHIQEAIKTLKSCIEEDSSLPEICMETIETIE